MPPDPSSLSAEDVVRVERILVSLEELALLTAATTRDELATDLRARKAILHGLIEVGEGASRLSQEAKDMLPDIPWRQIVQMRNVLVHVYWGIDLDRVWAATTVHAPELGRRLQTLVRPPA